MDLGFRGWRVANTNRTPTLVAMVSAVVKRTYLWAEKLRRCCGIPVGFLLKWRQHEAFALPVDRPGLPFAIEDSAMSVPACGIQIIKQ